LTLRLLLAVSIQSVSVTDRRTDRQTELPYRTCLMSFDENRKENAADAIKVIDLRGYNLQTVIKLASKHGHGRRFVCF